MKKSRWLTICLDGMYAIMQEVRQETRTLDGLIDKQTERLDGLLRLQEQQEQRIGALEAALAETDSKERTEQDGNDGES